MSKNHKPIDERELEQAKATAFALGEMTAAEAVQFERAQLLNSGASSEDSLHVQSARRIGELLRADIQGKKFEADSTSEEAQRCSNQVRESVLAALDAQETSLPVKPSPKRERRWTRTQVLGWSTVASVAVAIGGVAIWLNNGNTFQIAQNSSSADANKDPREKAIAASDFHDATMRVPAQSPGFTVPSSNGEQVKAAGESLKESDLALELTKNANEPAALDAFKAQVQSERSPTLLSAVQPMSAGSSNKFGARSNSQPSRAADQFGTGGDGAAREAKESLAGGVELFTPQDKDMAVQIVDAAEAVTDAPSQFRGMLGKLEGTEELQGKGRGLGSKTANNQPRTGIPYYNQMAPQGGAGGGDGSGGQKPAIQSFPNETGVAGRAATADGGGGFGGGEDRGRMNAEQDEAEMQKSRDLTRRNTLNESYKSLPENPFWRPIGERAMSTFSIDVDTASYANARRFLSEGSLPPPEAVRLEEFINYFHYDYPQPEEGTPFAVDLKLFGCPWNSQHSLLRVGLHGREMDTQKRPISNIVYLVDVSGSMSSDDKLPLLKRGLTMMVDHLGDNDTVSIVTYAGEAGVRMDPTKGTNKKRILDAIDSLQSGGSTNGAAGIEVAYQLAQQRFAQEGANRVILMTDGDLNVGVTSDDALVSLIKEKAAGGVFLTVLGFGTGNLKDAKLEGLADNGNGIYAYIDSLGEAHKVLVEQMSGNLVTIAKDVKIQIEFNPAQVAGYRLIGYENRVMANQDFANDRKDAGEIGAGHTVTALYEIVPVGAMLEAIDPSSPTLKYQTIPSVESGAKPQADARLQLKDAANSGELAQVALRYKVPEGTESRLIELNIKSEVTSFSQADADCRFAAAVAAFGMRLRQSIYAGNISYDAIMEIAGAATGKDPNGHRAEFVDLVRRAKAVSAGAQD